MDRTQNLNSESNQLDGSGTQPTKPDIMLLGMPRSGTTWIGKMVDSHPEVYYFHEPDSVAPMTSTPLFCTEYNDQVLDDTHQLIDGFPYRDEKCLGKRPFFHKSFVSDSKQKLSQLSVMASKLLKRNIIWIPEKELHNNNVHIAFKSIESVGRLKAFLLAESNLKIGLIIRSPFGQIASIIKGIQRKLFDHNDMQCVPKEELKNLYQKFGSQLSFSWQQVKSFSPIQQLAYRWLMFNEKALSEAEGFSDRVLIIKYDDVCDDASFHLKRIFHFFGLYINSQSLEFIKESNNTHDERYYSVNKNAQKAKSSWKKILPENDIKEIIEIIRNTQSGKLFGY